MVRGGKNTDYRRIIPCLDVKHGRLVKGVNSVNLQDVGDPAENAAASSDAGADGLVFLDLTATLENHKTLLDAVQRTVERTSVPLTVGGGISSCQAIDELLDLGVSQVSINTAAVRNPELVRQAAKKFGTDKITIAIDTARNADMSCGSEVMIRGGTTGTGIDAVEWAKKVTVSGPGRFCPRAWTPTASRPAASCP